MSSPVTTINDESVGNYEKLCVTPPNTVEQNSTKKNKLNSHADYDDSHDVKQIEAKEKKTKRNFYILLKYSFVRSN